MKTILVICPSFADFCQQIWDRSKGECEIQKNQCIAWVGETKYRYISRPQMLLKYRHATIEEWGPRPGGREQHYEWDDAIAKAS